MSNRNMAATNPCVQNACGEQTGNVPAPITRKFNKTTIGQRLDGYLNATSMCKANGKEWSHYQENSGTAAFVNELALSLGIPRDSLITSKPGRPDRGGGTWVHPRIAYHLAQWCSAKFAVKVTEWIEEIDTKGYVVAPGVSIAPTLAPARSQTPDAQFRDRLRSFKAAGFSTSEAAFAANRAILAQTGVDILGSGGVVRPDAKPVQALLPADHPKVLGPTEIGVEIGVRTRQGALSGRMVNTLLERHGFQIKGGTKTTPWHPTAKGEPFAQWEAPAKGGEHGGSANWLRWKFGIVAELIAATSAESHSPSDQTIQH
ncbi:KilA domain-containing protein [Azospirillum brasilense]|uniref:KilA domain-containing protein n=1 Tax=Azospirillum brasilense TaxID=192 RepID=A0A560BUW7_AZOBR|nr:KilA-N domain-containing protein [Azospirillum brasilense]TWA76422.1 KilA domain-containing protein [Azospirillum brasilense]